MNIKPFFTIITASFNNESTIKQTVESILSQTFQNLEHIVIDGGSTDGTIDILKKFGNSYNISWLSEPDQGIAEALKTDIISFPVILDHPVKGKVLRKPIRYLWWNHFKFIFPHQGCFVNKSVFKRIGSFSGKFKIALDYDFFYRALRNKCSVRFEKLPVALMGGEGVGSNPAYIVKRLNEEKMVQRLNEQNTFWRMAQSAFTLLYMPYKTKLLPKI